MNLNSDFGARAAVHSARLDWTPSPILGVDRRMLDRIGDDVARATSIVRYAPHSHFRRTRMMAAKSSLVLDGIFRGEHGDDPAGTYVRNPPASRHTPGSEPGCTIFVKLWQFERDDRTELRIDTLPSLSRRHRIAPASSWPHCSRTLASASGWNAGRPKR